nr:MAG TPA_asm: hypothetical protein [Caudoviricetes sp.]
MAKYIKKETALKVVEKYGLTNGSTLGKHTGLAICIASEIADIPAADVAPVVRCMDCKHLVAVNVNGKGIPTCRVSGMEVAPDEFCSRGEKGRR